MTCRRGLSCDPLPTDREVCRRAAASQERDSASSMLKKTLNGTGTLLDIGAHIGTIALPVAATGSRVVAIEMNPANCLRLIHGAIVNRLRNFWVVPFAASDFDGIAAFAGTDAWGYISKEAAALPTMCARLDTLAYSLQLGSEGASLAEPVARKSMSRATSYRSCAVVQSSCGNTGRSSFSNRRKSRAGPTLGPPPY